jgi:hypothetical protein
VDKRIAAVAARQHGVVSLRQLRRLGLSSSAVRSRVARGRLVPLHRSVYAVGHAVLRAEGHWLAAVLACGAGAALSHRSSGELQDLVDRWARTFIDVTTPRRLRHRSGIRLHYASTLTKPDLTIVAGIPCTSVSRTLLDLAETTSIERIEPILARAARLEVLDRRALEEVIARGEGRRGVGRLQAALELIDPLARMTRNELERRFLALCRAEGLPPPLVNAWIELPGGGIEVDFAWPDRRLAVETDGRDRHGTAAAFESDRRRDQRSTAAGWRVVRFTWRQVSSEPKLARATLRALFAEPATGP